MKIGFPAMISLKEKVLINLTIIIFVVGIGAIIFSQTFLKDRFQRLARKHISDKIEMVSKLIDAERKRLVQINKDWGAWDETYLFVQGKNTEYIKINLIPSSFITLDIQLLIYYDLYGNIIYSGEYDPDDDTIKVPEKELITRLTSIILNKELRNYLIQGCFTLIKNEPYLISAESILTSLHRGPLMGWILMARKLDLTPIMDLTGIMIEIRHNDSVGELCAFNTFSEINTFSVWHEKDEIHARYKFYDVQNERMIEVNVSENNEIMKQGQRSTLYIIGIILFFSFTTLLVVVVIMDTAVLEPIAQISEQIIKIDLEKIEKRITFSGSNREFSLLVDAVNNMLDTIDRQKEEIITSEKKYRELVENAEVGILIDDVEGNVVYFNEKLANLFGYTSDEFRILKMEDYIHPDDVKMIRIYHQRRIRKEDAPRIYEIRGLHKNGNIISLEVNTVVLQKEDKIIGTRNYIVDVTARKEIEEKLTIETMTDELTGLFNRRGFNALAQHQVSLARKIGKGFYVFYCDLNNMKRINDRFGHSAGDSALKQVAELLKKSFRKSDIIARVGGDEFIVLAPEAAKDSVNVMLNRLKKNIEDFNKINREPLLSLSVGFAFFSPDESQSLEDVINAADRMMYEEKLKYKNQI
ncbi:MAG: diguanylate cyclase [candidate division WOR-3 bacterium]|nr:diguanylate cyclase [candidate division WOR-3 bacterium]